MKPAVSVIVAARDYGHYLADALRSVQSQTFTDWELVLVDDGSKDDTPAVVQPFLADGRIRYVRTDTLGQSRAKNLGLQLSYAPLVAYLDGDDVWLPTKLERQVRLLNSSPGVGVVFCRRFLINPHSELLPSDHPRFHRGMIFNNILVKNFVCFSSVMFRRPVLEHVGPFDDRLELAIDYDLWLRAAKHYPFDFIDEPLVKYRTGHGNLSQRIVERITSVLSTMRRRLRRSPDDESTPAEVLRAAWGSTYRTMGFVQRDRNPKTAIGWYIRAASYDRRWPASFRAIVRGVLNSMGRGK